jgi:hypothetical protein
MITPKDNTPVGTNTPDAEAANKLGIARARYSNRLRQYMDLYDVGDLHELVVNAAKHDEGRAERFIYGISTAGTRALIEAFESMSEAEVDSYNQAIKAQLTNMDTEEGTRACRGCHENKADEGILEEAMRAVGERTNSYGPATQDFVRTAHMWEAILGIDIAPAQVALCMVALKISRACWSDNRDNWVDMAGYAKCGWDCVGGEEEGA